MDENRNLYATDDLPLAAWLLTRGHIPIGVNRDSHIVSWTFRDGDHLHDDIYTFQQGEPIDNVRKFDVARSILYKSINRPEELTLLARGFAKQ